MHVNNLKHIALSILSFVIILALLLTRQTITPAQGSTANVVVYDDQLSSQFSNWSWNSSINFSNTSPIYSGTKSIRFVPSSWGGLYLHSNTPIDKATVESLQFAMNTSDSSSNITLLLYDTNNQQLKSTYALSQYAGANKNGWTVYTIPLTSLSSSLNGFALQETSGKSGAIIYVDSIQLNVNQPTKSPTQTPIPTTTVPTPIATSVPQQSSNPLSGISFFNDSANDASVQQELQWQSSDPTDANLISKIANQSKAIWLGGGTTQSAVQNEITKSQSMNQLPIFVIYNIPDRDCGGYSSGGATSASAYQSWINSMALGIGNARSAVILEPDALAEISCLSQSDQQTRLSLLSYAVQQFKSLGHTTVYIDAGHSGWIAPNTMANLLKSTDVSLADGFSLNVANFDTNSDSIAYGEQISSLIQNKHFVIDTSRNGNGPTTDNAWCNPPGRALGDKPTSQTGNSLVDAYLWIKHPGESDGTCNGGPAAGVWYPSYALDLARNAKW